MLEEPIPGGKAVTASTDDLTPGRAKTGRPHPQALRSGVIAAVMDGASYRQVAARDGVSTSVAWRWSQRHTGTNGRGPLFKAEGRARWLPWRVATVPDLTLGQLQEDLRIHGIRVGRTALRRFLKKSIIETGNEQEVPATRCTMQRVCAIVAVMVVVASPAFTQSVSKVQKQRSLQPSSYGAYGGHKRYTDSDPNIKFEMMRQQNWRKGG